MFNSECPLCSEGHVNKYFYFFFYAWGNRIHDSNKKISIYKYETYVINPGGEILLLILSTHYVLELTKSARILPHEKSFDNKGVCVTRFLKENY